MSPNFLIVDDHDIFRQGLQTILRDLFPTCQISEAGTAAEAHSQTMNGGWALIFLDISLPGRSGLDVLKEIKSAHPEQRVLVLSVHPEKRYGIRALKNGASGYLTKQCPQEEVKRAVQRVLEGKRYVTPLLADELAMHLEAGTSGLPHEQLSDREYEVMTLIASGLTISEIAEKLSLSVKTISTYRSRMLKKMRMENNAELTSYAIRHDLA